MLVTLPSVLLLLDCVAPGEAATRGGRFPLATLVLEKAPLLLAGRGVLRRHRRGAAVRGDRSSRWSSSPFAVSVGQRPLISYATLSRENRLAARVGAASTSTRDAAVSRASGRQRGVAAADRRLDAAILRGGRKHPLPRVGWLWFLGMLVPVIGLVQVGDQAMADRYTYIPHLGLFLALSWGVGAVAAPRRRTARRAAILATAIVAVLRSGADAGTTLARRHHPLRPRAALDPELPRPGTFVRGRRRSGDTGASIDCYSLSIGINPLFLNARYNLGRADETGRRREAIDQFRSSSSGTPVTSAPA